MQKNVLCGIKKQRGIVSYMLVAVVSVLVLSSVIVGVIVVSNNVIGDNDAELLEQALTRIAGENGVTYSNIQVVQKNTTHARGQLTDSGDATTKNFYAQKNRDAWEIVSIGDNEPSCELYGARGFDPAFIVDCTQTFPDAVSVETAKELFRNATKPTFLQIIAKVVSIETIVKFISDTVSGNTPDDIAITEGVEADTEVVTQITVVSEEGTTLVTEIESSASNQTTVGDTIIIGVIGGPNPNDTAETVTTTSVINISTAAEEIPQQTTNNTSDEIESTNNSGTVSSENSSQQNVVTQDPSGDNGNVYKFIINTADVDQGDGLENVFDIDNSDVNIKIEG